MYIERGVVLLPTKEKSNIVCTNDFIKQTSYLKLVYSDVLLQKNILNQFHPMHLYITSDDEIKEGDWLYNPDLASVGQCMGEQRKNYYIDHNYKKIIAATDKSLEIVSKGINPVYEKLPEPFIELINYFITQYNLGNIITKVMVKYEEYNNETLIGLGINSNIYNLKVNNDNTINIKSIKDKYSKEELLEFVVWYSGMDRNKIEKQFDKYQEGYR